MIKVKGTTIYPNMIVEALNSIEELKQYIIEISTNGLVDSLLSFEDYLSSDIIKEKRQAMYGKVLA